MGEIRLYYKIEDLSSEWSKIYYYNGIYNNSKKKLESYTKRIKKVYFSELLEAFELNNDRLLYYMNEIEYSNLMEKFKKIRNINDDTPIYDDNDVKHLKNSIFNAIRLKIEFKAWFEYNGFPFPNS